MFHSLEQLIERWQRWNASLLLSDQGWFDVDQISVRIDRTQLGEFTIELLGDRT